MTRRNELVRLRQRADQVNICLLRMFLFPESNSLNQWVVNAYEYLHSTYEVGLIRKRYLSSDRIFKATFTENEHTLKDMIDTYIQISKRGYLTDKLVSRIFFHDELIGMVRKYHRGLSDKLSERGSISFSDVETMLHSSGFIDELPEEPVRIVQNTFYTLG